jgi:hypothetical protein
MKKEARHVEEVRLLQALSCFAALGHREVPMAMLVQRLEWSRAATQELVMPLRDLGLLRVVDDQVALDLASWRAKGASGLPALYARHVRAAPCPPPERCSLVVVGRGPPVFTRPSPVGATVLWPREEVLSPLRVVDSELSASQNLWRLRSSWGGGGFTTTLRMLYGGGVDGQTFMEIADGGCCFLLAFVDGEVPSSGADALCLRTPRVAQRRGQNGYELWTLSSRRVFICGDELYMDGEPRRCCALPGEARRGVFIFDVGPHR